VRAASRGRRVFRVTPAVRFLAVVLASCLGWSCGGSGGREVPSSTSDNDRNAAVRQFWELYGRGTDARIAGDFHSAAAAYESAIAIDADHQDSRFYLAMCLQETGDYAGAATLLRRLTERYPDHNPSFSQLAVVLSTLAPGATPEFDAAAEALERSEEMNPVYSGTYIRQGILELNRGNVDRARQRLSVAADTGAPEGLYLAGLTEFLAGDFEAASRYFLLVLELNVRERAISGRGVLSEGDVVAASGRKTRTALESSGLLALVSLNWASYRLGSYPEQAPESFRVVLERRSTAPAVFETRQVTQENGERGVWIDVDRDGRYELVLVDRSGVSVLRRRPQRTGGWQDVTERSGLSAAPPCRNAVTLDVDGDEWTDLYMIGGGVFSSGENRLYRNDHGRFVDVTEKWGLPTGPRETAAVLAADFDGVGGDDLLEVGNRRDGVSPVRLYYNDGSSFTERGRDVGLTSTSHAVDAAATDFDRDGRLDLFILNWKAPSRLYRNTVEGFIDVTTRAGLSGAGGDGLSTLFFDYDRDGHDDLLVTAHAPPADSIFRLLTRPASISSPALDRYASRLYRNTQTGGFEDVTVEVGLNRSFGVMQAVAGDFDGDGWLDLLFANGGFDATHLEPSLVLRNRQAEGFDEWSYLPGIREPVRSLGAAVADVEGDGDIDIYLSGAGFIENRSSVRP